MNRHLRCLELKHEVLPSPQKSRTRADCRSRWKTSLRHHRFPSAAHWNAFAAKAGRKCYPRLKALPELLGKDRYGIHHV